MQEILIARLAGDGAEREKAICLNCRCRWKTRQGTADIVDMHGDIDLWFPKGPGWPSSGHVKRVGEAWFARSWILQKNEEKEAQKRPGCISFEIRVVGEDGERDLSESASTPETPALIDDQERRPDGLPF